MPARGRKKAAPAAAEVVEEKSDGDVGKAQIPRETRRRGARKVKTDSENNDSKTEKRTTGKRQM